MGDLAGLHITTESIRRPGVRPGNPISAPMPPVVTPTTSPQYRRFHSLQGRWHYPDFFNFIWHRPPPFRRFLRVFGFIDSNAYATQLGRSGSGIAAASAMLYFLNEFSAELADGGPYRQTFYPHE
jgi:hypothetical protein